MRVKLRHTIHIIYIYHTIRIYVVILLMIYLTISFGINIYQSFGALVGTESFLSNAIEFIPRCSEQHASSCISLSPRESGPSFSGQHEHGPKIKA